MNGTNYADHTRESKEKIVNFLLSNGVSSKLVWLGDYHIMGNGHMMMLEKNSDEIAKLIYSSIKK